MYGGFVMVQWQCDIPTPPPTHTYLNQHGAYIQHRMEAIKGQDCDLFKL